MGQKKKKVERNVFGDVIPERAEGPLTKEQAAHRGAGHAVLKHLSAGFHQGSSPPYPTPVKASTKKKPAAKKKRVGK